MNALDHDKFFKLIFERTPLPALVIDPVDKIVLKANKAALKLYGINLEGKNVSRINYYPDKNYVPLRDQLTRRKITSIQTKHIVEKNKIIDVECHVSVISHEGRKLFLTLIRDITNETAKKEKLINEASMDELTQIPNRRFFITILENFLENLKRYNEKFSLIYFDIDNFKYYNDQYGHAFGDQILKNTVRSINKEKRAGDFLARLSGDEFVLILNRVLNESDLAKICNNLSAVIKKSSTHVMPPVSVSIGGYLVTKFESHEKIIAKIDRAMYTSKRRGGDSFHIVSSGPYQNTSELIHLLEGMNHAHHNKFEVLYQPIIDLKGNSVHKVEVLLSPRSATLKALTTAEIIKDAIKHHLISNVTYFVLDKACHDFSDGIKNIRPNLTLGINITLHELIYDFPLLSNSLKTILKKYVVRPRQIVLEINEFSLTSIDSKDLDRAYKSIRQLKALGFGIAVDDFGSGYSNLPYFHEIDIDYLKIDKSYLQKIFAKNNKAEKIYRAICELSHNLGIRVTAEGIESEKQLDYMNQVGVDFGQGYYFSRPLSIKKLISFLKKN